MPVSISMSSAVPLVFALLNLFIAVHLVYRAVTLALKTNRTELEAREAAKAGALATFALVVSLVSFMTALLIPILERVSS